jgi:hypothetical protein
MGNVKSYKIESIKYDNDDIGNIFKIGVGINNNISVKEDVNEKEDENINLGTMKINFWFTNDGITKIHILLRKLLIEYSMFN